MGASVSSPVWTTYRTTITVKIICDENGCQRMVKLTSQPTHLRTAPTTKVCVAAVPAGTFGPDGPEWNAVGQPAKSLMLSSRSRLAGPGDVVVRTDKPRPTGPDEESVQST